MEDFKELKAIRREMERHFPDEYLTRLYKLDGKQMFIFSIQPLKPNRVIPNSDFGLMIEISGDSILYRETNGAESRPLVSLNENTIMPAIRAFIAGHIRNCIMSHPHEMVTHPWMDAIMEEHARDVLHHKAVLEQMTSIMKPFIPMEQVEGHIAIHQSPFPRCLVSMTLVNMIDANGKIVLEAKEQNTFNVHAIHKRQKIDICLGESLERCQERIEDFIKKHSSHENTPHP